MTAKQYAQHLFDKAIWPLLDLPLTPDMTKTIGLELAQRMLDEIMDHNNNHMENDWLCEVNTFINEEDIEY